jgi:ribulose-phosphate 3-epimerase
MASTLILPSVLAADFLRLGEEVRAAQDAGADMLHVDVMDGHFVPNLTLGPPVVAALRRATTLPLDVHLMIEQPARSVDQYIDAGADIICVQAETDAHLHRLLQHINERGKRAAVALNPHTPWQIVEHILPLCHHILCMTVNPGFGGQSFITLVLPKIAQLRAHIQARGLAVRIEVDGGVTAATCTTAVQAGADMLVAGTAIFGASDRAAALAALRAAAARA